MIRATAGWGVSGTVGAGARSNSARPPRSQGGQAAVRTTGSKAPGASGGEVAMAIGQARAKAAHKPTSTDHAATPRRRRLTGAISMRAIPFVGDNHAEQTVAHFAEHRVARFTFGFRRSAPPAVLTAGKGYDFRFDFKRRHRQD